MKQEKVHTPVMSEWEIAREYEAAKDKTEQIKILADLNLVPRGVITEILARKGLLEKKTARKDGRGKRKKEENPEEVLSMIALLLNRGFCRKKIAEYMAMSIGQTNGRVKELKERGMI